MVRICLQCRRPRFNPGVGKIHWKREQLPTPVFWPGEFQGLYSTWGHKQSDTTERLSLLLSVPNSHNARMWLLLISPFYRLGNLRIRKSSNLPKATHTHTHTHRVSDKAGSHTQATWFQSLCLNLSLASPGPSLKRPFVCASLPVLPPCSRQALTEANGTVTTATKQELSP